MRVLVVNAGSSTLKLSVLDERDQVLGSRVLELEEGAWSASAVEEALGEWPEPQAVGHRVVHGGRDFTAPTRLDQDVVERLRELTPLAPLHQPRALAGIEVVERVLPGCAGVACFDTAFHTTLPQEASTYAVPEEWRRRWGLVRYGFHGLSHAYASRRAREWTGGERVVTAHLGAGASLAAVWDGRCVDTTMGFTPLEGLVMATRSGSVDPGLVVWLHEQAGLPVREISEGLVRRSGLLGLAGTADMREVVEREGRGDRAAVLALGVYVHRLRGAVASMAASMGGVDTLVFTGGVGEGAARVRESVARGLGFVGVRVDEDANAQLKGEGEVSAQGARVRTLVVAAREDVEIARGVRQVLADG